MGKTWRSTRAFSHKQKPSKKRRYSIRRWTLVLPYWTRCPLREAQRYFDSIKEAESVGLYLSRNQSYEGTTYALYDEQEQKLIRLFDPKPACTPRKWWWTHY